MKFLVTGGAGFIGGNFAHYMVNTYPEDQIVVLDLLTYAGNLETLEPIMDKPNFKFVKGDIRDRELIDQLFADEKFDMVVNFAAETHVDVYKRQDLDLYISQYGRENLLEVTDITTKADYAAEFEHYSGDTYKAYYVEATWNYKSSSKIDVNGFQKTGYFTVVDNDGRYEIAQFFDHYD